MLSAIDIAWAAGFLEGEGWFGCTGKSSLVIAASQVNPEPLFRLQRIIGGNVRGPYLKGGKTHSPHFEWTACGHRAGGVMMTLFTLMSAKRRAQIIPALARWRVGKDHTGMNWKCRNGHAYTRENTGYIKRAGRAKLSRVCKTCSRIAEKKHHDKKKGKVIHLAFGNRLS